MIHAYIKIFVTHTKCLSVGGIGGAALQAVTGGTWRRLKSGGKIKSFEVNTPIVLQSI